jgi:hypothetical protein
MYCVYEFYLETKNEIFEPACVNSAEIEIKFCMQIIKIWRYRIQGIPLEMMSALTSGHKSQAYKPKMKNTIQKNVN